MQYEGVLTKMQTELASPINYFLVFPKQFIHMNQLLNQKIEIQHTGYECLNCGKNKKIFRQGFCYDCFMSSPAVGDWIMRPELSTAHLDIEDRDLAYEKKVQLQPHVVYLAFNHETKVGVTRKTQVPTRWIDQGASFALPILKVPNRYLAGMAEIFLKKFYTDKTNWRKMLQNDVMEINLDKIKEKIKSELTDEFLPYFQEHAALQKLEYPVQHYPAKVNSLNLEKTPHFEGTIIGIKGQYLLFEDGTVLNIRSHEGFVIHLQVKVV